MENYIDTFFDWIIIFIFIFMHSNNKNNFGFTLLELLIVMSVMSVLTTFFLVGYRTAGKESDLRLTAGQLMSDIRMAQSKTLGASKYEGQVPQGGWGIRLEEDKGTYVIFADMDGDFSYDKDTEKWKTEDMPEDIVFSSVDRASPVDIVFEPPDPLTYINGSNEGEVNIVIADNSGNSKRIRVNFFGLIEAVE